MKNAVYGFITVLIFMLVIAGGSSSANAKNETATIHTTPPEHAYYEELNGLYLELPYAQEDVTVERGADTLTILDAETGDLVEKIQLTESVEARNDHPLLPPPITVPPEEEFMEMNSTQEHMGLEVVLNVRFVVTKNLDGVYEDVVDIRDAWWTTGSGPHTLEDSNTDILHGDFPVKEFTVTGQTTIVTQIDAGAQAGFEAAGFSVGVDVSGTYYARMTVRDTMVFDLF
ncbi:hypothetical protein MM326_03080 [Alkalihalobacillus sp. LMS6]|uniref:hypothetical protein n=1 Tax=Bacillaceae TaxID=186817 RepID=UPI000C07DB62|nr:MULTISPECIES: hypothetical protein [Bacillaceae]UTR07031.1 hypothetical protein MM326_03080 [Alkalihalobacillus sp. LMS6]